MTIEVSKLTDTELADLGLTVAAEQAKRAALRTAGAVAVPKPSEPASAETSAPNMSIDEVAHEMRVSKPTVRRRVAAGIYPKPLPHTRGQHARWRRSDIAAMRLAVVDAEAVARVLSLPEDGENDQPASKKEIMFHGRSIQNGPILNSR
jgi:hypothetical protein